jgi:hypothetical protein
MIARKKISGRYFALGLEAEMRSQCISFNDDGYTMALAA